MNYFEGITDLEKAKQRYRELAKRLHPDKGGTANEFQKMQEEYRLLLMGLQQNRKGVTRNQTSPESELLSELGKLATVLIKKESTAGISETSNYQKPIPNGTKDLYGNNFSIGRTVEISIETLFIVVNICYICDNKHLIKCN